MREDKSLEILESQVAELKEQLKAMAKERDDAYAAVVETESSRDELAKSVDSDKTKLTAAEKRVQELEHSARERVHFDKFSELAKGQGAVGDHAVKHLWKLAEYKAEDEEPDEKALTKLVARLQKEADYAFKPAPSPEETAADRKPVVTSRTRYGLDIRDDREPPGGGRSERNKGGDGTIITREMRADPRFMLDPSNRALIAEAAREHRFAP